MTKAAVARRPARRTDAPRAQKLTLFQIHERRGTKWRQVGAVSAVSEHHAVAYAARAFARPVYVHQAGTPFEPVRFG